MAGVFDNHNWGWSIVGIRGSLYNCLHAFLNEAGGTGVIEKMSAQLLSERCNVTKETARQLGRELERLGFIRREGRTIPATGQRITNKYYLLRGRLFPKDTKDYRGEAIGQKVWKSLLDQLTALRGKQNTFLLGSQIRDVFFDSSNRTDKDARFRKGILYLVAETDTVDESFKENLKWLLKLQVQGHRITYIRLLHRIRFKG